jgi:quinol monooxygenase YgiN
MSKFGLYGKFTVKEGERDTLVDILLEAAESMEKLDECEIYLVNISNDEPNSVLVYEVWSNENAHQASLSLEATQTLINRAKPIITGMERISTLNPRGGKGISTDSY